MNQGWSVTHRDEQFWRLMVALFGVGMYVMVTVMIPAYSTVRSISPSAGVLAALFAMMALGALFISLSPVVWKYWLTAIFELAATGLAVCAAWVLVEGISVMPKNLWPVPAFLLYVFGSLFVLGAAQFRIHERNMQISGYGARIMWEALLPLAMGTGTVFILEGDSAVAISVIILFMTALMLWQPRWKTSEIQSCCPG